VELLPIGTSLYMPAGSVAVSPDRRYVLMRFPDNGIQFRTIRGVSEYNLGVGTTAIGSVDSDNPINDPSQSRRGMFSGADTPTGNTNTPSGGR